MSSVARRDEPPEGLMAMLRLAVPLIIINVSVTMMQFVDAWMVSALGEEPLAASLPAGLIFFVPIAFGMGALGAVNTFVSQCLGRKESGRCGDYAWQGIYLAVAGGVAMLGLWGLAPGIFAMFGHEPEVQRLEVIYFRICLFEGVPLLVGMVLSNFFVGIHRTNVLAIFAVLATLLNAGFNWVLIFGKLGFPAMGLAGAAWGTVLAVTIQTLGLMAVFLRGSMRREFGTGIKRASWRKMREVMRIGLPSGVQYGFDIMSWGVALVWMVGTFGTAALAATTIIVRYMHIGFMPPIALATVLVAMVGKSIGEGNRDRARRQVRTAFRAAVVYMGMVAVIFFVFRESSLRVFSDSPEVVGIGAGIMFCVAFFQIFDAMNIVFSHALRGAGDTFWQAAVTAVLCVTVFLGGGLAVVTWLPEWGAVGPWIMGTVYLGVLGAAMFWRWQSGAWSRMAIFSEDRVPDSAGF